MDSTFFMDGEVTGVMVGGVWKNGSWVSVWDFLMKEDKVEDSELPLESG